MREDDFSHLDSDPRARQIARRRGSKEPGARCRFKHRSTVWAEVDEQMFLDKALD